ncbi:MAG: Flp pilus assembly protein CpaB [Caulobacteraceae bacterium]
MSPIRIVILAVAAVAAIGLALVVRNLASNNAGPAQPAAAAAPVDTRPMTRVLVAKIDVPVGTSLSPANMSWQSWPADAVNPQFITDGSAPAPAPTGAAAAAQTAQRTAGDMMGGGQAMQALAGAIARTPILAGEPITAQKIVRGGEGGYMSVVLQPGFRAMAVPVNAETAVGGFILPGDRVDVITSRQARDSDNGFISETVLRNVRVLAIDQTTEPAKDSRTIVGAVVTLEIPQGDIEVMARAKAQGNVVLALHSYADIGGAAGRASPAAAETRSVRIFRAGQASEIEVAR